ncbi:MAG: hypothetical protein ONB23_08030, partial [candidate division KSB1 bacterium]|nr:hypothetical protein [candidate division KSB1 bacterium]
MRWGSEGQRRLWAWLVVLGVGLLQGCGSRQGSLPESLPSLGEPMRRQLRVLGVGPDTVVARYGAVLLLSRKGVSSAEAVLSAVGFLREQGFFVCLVVPSREGLDGGRFSGVVVRDDPEGRVARRFGLRGLASGFVVFQTRGAICWG